MKYSSEKLNNLIRKRTRREDILDFSIWIEGNEDIPDRDKVSRSAIYEWLNGRGKRTETKLVRLLKLNSVDELRTYCAIDDDNSEQLLWNLPPPNNFFTGRVHLLIALKEAFNKTTPVGITQPQVICGLGGIGKTQTAIQYAYLNRNKYKAIFRVISDSESSLTAGFIEIARLLDLIGYDENKPAVTVQLMIDWLNRTSDWLLILDGADKPELVKRFLPLTPKGHVLLTSRAQVFDMLGISSPISIAVMTSEEALEFFYRRTDRDGNNLAERDAAGVLSEELGYLPLALEQAGAYISVNKASFQDYLVVYQRRKLELLESPPLAGDYQQSVATTWSLNFQEVEKQSEASADLLRFSAFLHPDNIPFELIATGGSKLGRALVSFLEDVDDDPLVISRVLEPLTRYSLVNIDINSRTYSIHCLVQEALRDTMDKESRRLWADRTVRAVDQAFPVVEEELEFEFEKCSLCNRLRSHAKVAINLIADWDLGFHDADKFLNKVGIYLYRISQPIEAESCWMQALDIVSRTFGLEHLRTAAILQSLGIMDVIRGQYEKAESRYKQALDIHIKAHGLEHSGSGGALTSLALVYFSKGQYAEAESCWLQALDILKTTRGTEYADTATIMCNLISLYHDQGLDGKAEILKQQIFDIFEVMLKREHTRVSTLYDLGQISYKLGQYRTAIVFLQKAIVVSHKANDHHSEGFVHFGLARMYYELGNFEKAVASGTDALGIFERVGDPQFFDVRRVLGSWHRQTYKLKNCGNRDLGA